jgi:small subunit ribosomal protein S18
MLRKKESRKKKCGLEDMRKKLFISNLDFEITTDELRDLFSAAAPTFSVVIATDRETKRSKGFAFVEMESEDAATAAIQALNGKVVNGRPIKVVEDRGKGTPAPGAPGAPGAAGAPEGEGRRYEPLPPIQRMQLFKRRRKLDPFLEDPKAVIDYRDVTMLSRFLSERGRILSRRLTGLSAYNQRKVSKAIKRAQNLGLLPFSAV